MLHKKFAFKPFAAHEGVKRYGLRKYTHSGWQQNTNSFFIAISAIGAVF
jgi:hypothetical protein